MQQVLLEAVVVGLLLIPAYIIGKMVLGGPEVPFKTLFAVGAGFHLFCEVTGLNAYYVKIHCK